MNALPSRAAIALALGTIYLVWGSTYLAIRVAVETMPPFLMASARFLVAGGFLLAFLKLRGAPTPTAHQWRANTVIGGFLLLGGNGCNGGCRAWRLQLSAGHSARQLGGGR